MDTPQSEDASSEIKNVLNCLMPPEFSARKAILELRSQINGGYPYLDQSAFYIDPISSTEWLSVANHKTYQSMRHSLAYEDIAQQLVHMLTERSHTEELDIVALGPSQAFEECILAQLMAEHFKKIRIFLIDVSDGLLEEALAATREIQTHNRNITAYAVRGDFRQLWSYLPRMSLPRPGRRRLITAFTILYNMQDELAFMHNNLVHFDKDDLFLGDLIRVAAPVEEAELVHQREVRLSKSKKVMGWDDALDSWHANILKRYCYHFENVQFEYKLDIYGCLIPGSYTVDKIAHVRLNNGTTRTLVVQRYKRYPPDKFVFSFQRLGWLPINNWAFGKLQERIVYLFQKEKPL